MSTELEYEEGDGMPMPTSDVTLTSVPSTQLLLLASLSLGVLLVAIVVYVFRKKSSARGSSVLLLGVSDAGKTAVLTTLVYDQTLPTHASLQTNTSDVIFSPTVKRALRIVDIPGHPRLRGDFKQHIPDAKAVVFVVDSSTIARNCAAVAEHLHDILNALASVPLSRTPPSLAILAHKADLLAVPSSTTAASQVSARQQLAVTRVRTILERELEKRRVSHAGDVGIEGLGADKKDGSDDGLEMGGLECHGGTFKFAEWSAGDVAFLGSFVKVGAIVREDDEKGEETDVNDGLMSFRDWLLDLP